LVFYFQIHKGKQGQRNRVVTAPSDDTVGDVTTISLAERLKGQHEPLPPSLLRKYIAYARKYVQPRITPEAAQVIKEFYLSLRSQYRSVDSTPITTRQLESMIRLCEARARAEIREEATERDARDVVELMKHSLFETCTDEFGNIDFGRSQMGIVL